MYKIHSKYLNLILSNSEKKKFINFSFLLIFGIFLEVFGLLILYPVIKVFVDPNFSIVSMIPENLSLIKNLFANKLLLILFITFIYIFKTLFLIFFFDKLHKFLSDSVVNLNNRLFNLYIHESHEIRSQQNTSDTLQILQNETYSFFHYLRGLMILLCELLFFISIYLCLFYIEPIGTISISITLLIIYSLFYFLIMKKNIEWGKKRNNADMKLSRIILETFGLLTNIKIDNKYSFFQEKFFNQSKIKGRMHANQLTFEQLPRFFIEIVLILVVLAYLGTLYLINYDLISIVTSVGILTAATFRLVPSINKIFSSIQTVRFHNYSVELIYNQITEKEKTHNSNHINEKEKILSFQNKISIDDITFKYINNSKNAINKLSIEINKGDFFGIVGESGSGKSTLVNLICGLLKPSLGSIHVDNKSIMKNLVSWQSNIGYVGQKTFLMDTTILNNIAYGELNNEIDYKKINEVISLVKLDSLITSLKNGIYTKVGEDGTQISGGQKQRIGIARAIYKNPSLIIFDEATNSLDFDTESSLLEDLTKLKGVATLLFISHNKNSLRICNKIFDINKMHYIRDE